MNTRKNLVDSSGWIEYFTGSANAGDAGSGILLISESGEARTPEAPPLGSPAVLLLVLRNLRNEQLNLSPWPDLDRSLLYCVSVDVNLDVLAVLAAHAEPTSTYPLDSGYLQLQLSR